jgi:ATP-dependent RNA helicase DDX56/DBP9
VPTRELADQVYKATEALSAFCAKDVRAVKLTDKVPEGVLRSILSDNPDVVISTPSRVLSSTSPGGLSLEGLRQLVVDEADLVLSYGYDADLQSIASALPKGVQTILMSATLTTEVDTLKGLFCRDPVLLDLEERDDAGSSLTQFVVKYVCP